MRLDEPIPLEDQDDKELTRFWISAGRERPDLLREADDEVRRIIHVLSHGAKVPYEQRKLVALALYGNAVDTYKFYEYNYQREYLAHYYLPEHGEYYPT